MNGSWIPYLLLIRFTIWRYKSSLFKLNLSAIPPPGITIANLMAHLL